MSRSAATLSRETSTENPFHSVENSRRCVKATPSDFAAALKAACSDFSESARPPLTEGAPRSSTNHAFVDSLNVPAASGAEPSESAPTAVGTTSRHAIAAIPNATRRLRFVILSPFDISSLDRRHAEQAGRLRPLSDWLIVPPAERMSRNDYVRLSVLPESRSRARSTPNLYAFQKRVR